MKLLTATIIKEPRIVNTKFGPRAVADLTLSNGENATLWQPENSKIINYGTGQKITVSIDSKGKLHFVEPDEETAIANNPEPTQSTDLSNAQKRQIAEFITQQTKLFSFCYAQTALIDNLPNEDRRAVATTLYLGAVKKFNLG